MSKIVVIYKTKYESTKLYANWISEELGCDIFEAGNISLEKLKNYETIIYGGALFAKAIKGISFIKKNFHIISDKKILIFSVGVSTPSEKLLNDIQCQNFSEEMKNKIKFFYLKGAFDYKKLSLLDKVLIFTMKNILEKKKDELTDEEKILVDVYYNPVNYIRKEAIVPLIEYINN